MYLNVYYTIIYHKSTDFIMIVAQYETELWGCGNKYELIYLICKFGVENYVDM